MVAQQLSRSAREGKSFPQSVFFLLVKSILTRSEQSASKWFVCLMKMKSYFGKKWIGVVLLGVGVLAIPGNESFVAVGAIDCNSQAAMKQHDCVDASGADCGQPVQKCNMSLGSKTKLCNADSGGKCTKAPGNPTPCVPNVYGDKFAEDIVCTAQYN
jgi:hypothetical protein